MDDKSIVSDRERQIDAEVEAEKRQANKVPPDDRDAATTSRTDTAAPNSTGGGAGVDVTTATAGRVGDFPGAATAGLEEADAYPGAGPGDADQRDVDADDRPGESFSPRSG